MYIDLEKYCEHPWYEIASIPQIYSRGCEYVRAQYTLNKDDGTISIMNECAVIDTNTKRVVKYRNITGTGMSVSDDNTLLEIVFMNYIRGLYHIIEVVTSDDGVYLYALVGGGPNSNSLWVLSINQCIPDSVYKHLLNKAKNEGYNIDKLQKTVFTTIFEDDEHEPDYISLNNTPTCMHDYLPLNYGGTRINDNESILTKIMRMIFNF